MHNLSTIDLLIVIGYIVGTTALGAMFSGKQRDLKTYFVGERNVGWFLVLVSIVATETSTVTFLSVPGITADPNKGGNLMFLQLCMGYLVGRIMISVFLLPQFFRGECFSAYEVLRTKFGPSVQRTASAIFLVTRTLADGLRLYLTAILLHQFTGWDLYVAIAVMGISTIVYTYLGGMQAVIWTDLIQFVIYTLGALLAGYFILQGIPGGWDTFLSVGNEHRKFELFDFTPTLNMKYNFFAGLIGGTFVSMASHGADQIMVQRYLCAKNLNQARFALISSGLVVAVQFTLFLLIGIGLFVLNQSGEFPLENGTKSDDIFGQFIVQKLPIGLIGLVVAAVLAAAMSTLSSSLNSSSNAFVTDFYRPLVKGRSEEHYVRLSKLMTAIFGVAQITVAVLATFVKNNEGVINQVLEIASLTTGIILGIFLLGLVKRPIASHFAILGIICGMMTVLSVRQFTPVAWPWYSPIGALTTFGVAYILDLIFASGHRTHGSSADRSS
jgi:SSS family solute:Na+ symporter